MCHEVFTHLRCYCDGDPSPTSNTCWAGRITLQLLLQLEFLKRPNFFLVKLELQGRTECLIRRQHCEHFLSMLGYRGMTGCKIKLFLRGRIVLLNMHTGWAWVLRGAAISRDVTLLSLKNSSRSITIHPAFILPFLPPPLHIESRAFHRGARLPIEILRSAAFSKVGMKMCLACRQRATWDSFQIMVLEQLLD